MLTDADRFICISNTSDQRLNPAFFISSTVILCILMINVVSDLVKLEILVYQRRSVKRQCHDVYLAYIVSEREVPLRNA